MQYLYEQRVELNGIAYAFICGTVRLFLFLVRLVDHHRSFYSGIFVVDSRRVEAFLLLDIQKTTTFRFAVFAIRILVPCSAADDDAVVWCSASTALEMALVFSQKRGHSSICLVYVYDELFVFFGRWTTRGLLRRYLHLRAAWLRESGHCIGIGPWSSATSRKGPTPLQLVRATCQ
jgi:hypothetical protein